MTTWPSPLSSLAEVDGTTHRGRPIPAKLDPSRAVVYLNLGDAIAMLADQTRAKRAHETYLALAPNGRDAARVKQAVAGLQ
jgi:hypothetical protein